MDDTFRERLEEAFDKYEGPSRGLAKRIADKCDVSDQAVGRWRKTGKVQRENLAPLADELGVSVEWLLTGRGEMRQRVVGDMDVLIAGDTSKGVDPKKTIRKPAAGDLVVHIASVYGSAFAVRVVGSPELWPRYNEGEIVVVSAEGSLQQGSDVFVQERKGTRRTASIYRMAWERAGEVALDPVAGAAGEGRIVTDASKAEICRPVLAILPPLAIEKYQS